MTGQEDPREALCMHCGKEANWRFVDDGKNVIEVGCPDCGRFQVPSVDFERDEFEIVEAVERGE
jgi:predicted  nucleic acid-binding Zn-ribbon protein